MDLQEEVLNTDNPIIFRNRSSVYQYYLRKASVLFILVSMLSFLLSFFTGLSILHTYTYYLSTFLLPFLTQTFERKYMFLVCNGILIFLAGKSGLRGATGLPSGLDQMEAEDEPVDVINRNIMDIEAETSSNGDELLEARAEDYGAPDEAIETESSKLVIEQEEDDSECEEPASNTEELNRKIEEFIRKMKEELKLEAQQQQLIAA